MPYLPNQFAEWCFGFWNLLMAIPAVRREGSPPPSPLHKEMILSSSPEEEKLGVRQFQYTRTHTFQTMC
jgi:hypothetical protein